MKTKKFLYKLLVLVTALNLVLQQAGIFWFNAGGTRSVQAASRAITERVDFDGGYYNGVESKSKEGEIKLASDGTWNARVWNTPAMALGDQAAIASDGNYVYLLHNADNRFVRYLPSENRWQTLASAPHYAYPGASLTVLGDYIYAAYGGYQLEFSRYSISTNTWEDLENLKDLIWNGSTATTDGTYIYLLRGSATQDFWKYDPSDDTWSTLSSPAAAIYSGAGMAYYGGNLYVTRGYSTTTMYRYNISANTWYTTATGGSALAAAPATFNEDTTITIKNDELFVVRGINTNTYYKYNITSNAWSVLTNAPQTTRYVGNVYNSADGYIYVFRGNGTYDMWKYNPATNSFVGNTDLPNTPGSGADLVYYNGYLYFARGNNSQNLYGYNLSNSTWSTLANNTNWTLNDDTKGVQAGGKIYFFRGSNTRNFAYYDVAGNSWTTRADTSANVSYGGSLAYTGSGDYLYAARGGNTASFWRYSISGDSWDDASVADLPDNSEASYGSRLVSDGTNLYLIPGYGRNNLLKYTVSGNSWSVISSLPFAPNWGTDMAHYNGKLYLQAGYYKDQFWEYSIAGNSWRRLPNIQTNYAYDIGPYNGGSLETDGSGNFYTISGQNITQLNSFTVSSYNYPVSGTWTSGAIDLSHVSSWTSLSSSATTPGDSSISLETRSGSNGVTWSNWQALSGSSIQSPAARYMQIRATLTATTDRSATPVISSLTINYTGDENAPSNPTTFTGKSQAVGGVDITSGGSYQYHQPYFSWTGASDTETNVAGYYVYYGTSSSADPAVSGNYQTTANYTATLQMTNGITYYLRLKTKDTSGNISSATTGFTYTYTGVSPPQTVTQTSTSDFSGTATDVSVTGDEIKLESKSGFWQQERLSVAPGTIYNGADMAHVSSSNKIYTLRGNSQNFYEYDMATDVWSSKANTPASVSYGGSIENGPAGYLFALRGANTSSFWRYDISANTWSDEAAANSPQAAGTGASLEYDENQYIYMIRGGNDDAFLRYDTLSDTWDTLANTDFGSPTTQTNNLVGYGGDLAYDGSGTIYAIQGNTRSGFASYNISTNSWTPLPNTPALTYYGGRIEYDETSDSVYYLPGWDKPYFYKYDVSSRTWSTLSEAPAVFGYGASIVNISGNLYVLRGANVTTFYKYNIANDSWLIPTVGLFDSLFRGTDYRTFNYGADIVRGDGNNYYITRGNWDNLFIRYNGVTGDTVRMADAPSGFYYGAELVYDSANNKIYATANIYNRKFFIYDVATDAWSEEASDPPPYDVNTGVAMEYDGSRYIYWVRGGSTQNFHRFDTQGTPGAKWSALTNTPATMGYGADLVIKNDYLYALRGNNQLGFYRYGPLSGTPAWSDPAVADLPTGKTIYNDGFLVDSGGDYLYSCRGGNSNECFRYSVSGNTWTAIANAPAQISQGGSAASNGADKIFVIAGPGTNTFSNGLYTYVMQTSTSSFEESGNYLSPSHDLTATYKYANINVTYTSATNSTLTVYTQSSSDNSTWSDWSEASEVKSVGTTYTYKINSPAARYVKIKFSMTSADGIYSGTISDYTIYYYQDVNSPTNPTTLNAYSTSTQSAAITTNTWYNHTAPNFDWPDADTVGGATDGTGGSGIAGYYVYFGTNSAADASTSGTLTTATSYTASNLTSGETYYLRIQSVDDDGNFAASNWQPFVYKFDNDAPTNPVTISVNPPGYTSVNDFDFTMKGATDSASGIASFCYKYKTGETDGNIAYSSESCITEIDGQGTATASAVLAYESGESNTFYVRARDAAGNYAPTYATQIYKYSGEAPSKPTNLRVTYPTDSSSNTVNQFAFAWDAPESFSGSESGLRYYYSINALPTGNNVNEIGLSDTYLSTDAYATQKGDNKLYVVTKDEAGNIDYTNYAQVTFTADTSAPGIARNIDISDVSIKETSSWRLALSWDAPEASGSGVASYKIYRSAVEDSVCTSNYADFNYVASTTQTSYVDTGLTQTKKYYCVKACDSTNECSAASDTVSLYPDGRWRVAPTLSGDPTVSVKTKSATVSWSTSRTANSFVKYGKTSGSYGDEVGSSTQVTSHTISLTGLDPGTTYYYKVQWTDEDGNSGSSDEFTFVTSPAPHVSSVKFSGVNINSLYVNFTISNAVKATLNYGKTVNYGGSESISTSTNESTYTIALSGLTEGTLYHLKITGEDSEGNAYDSDDYTFETLPTPKILNLKVQQVAGMPTATLRLVWSSNTLISSIVTYYPTGSPEKALDQINLALKKNHEVVIKNLIDSTDYTIDVKGKDSAGNEATMVSRKLKTSQDMRAPEIQNMNVESTIVGVGETARAQIVVSWDTDEPSTTQVEYAQGTGTSYGQTTQEDSNLTQNHTVTITGLTPAKIYHLRAISKDKVNNIGQSFDTVIITPKSTKDALNLVIDNLSETFGFLNNLRINR